MFKIDQVSEFRNGIILERLSTSWHGVGIRGFGMTSTYKWFESYRAALLETEWTKKMQERLQAAESEIQKRQHVLSMDHGGTSEERQAIANALNGMKTLRTELAEWQTQQPPDGVAATPD